MFLASARLPLSWHAAANAKPNQKRLKEVLLFLNLRQHVTALAAIYASSVLCHETVMSARRTKTLTAMTAETLAERTQAGEKLLAIDGIVFDVSVWAKKHPGGPELLYSCSKADATDIF